MGESKVVAFGVFSTGFVLELGTFCRTCRREGRGEYYKIDNT